VVVSARDDRALLEIVCREACWEIDRVTAAGIIDAVRQHHAAELLALRADVTRLTASLAAAAAQWQPIETAPKDGSLIIITSGDKSAFARWGRIGSRDTLNDIDGVAVFATEYGWHSANDKAFQRIRPTDWMPRPLSPAELAALSAPAS
jgi:hypothetical protein